MEKFSSEINLFTLERKQMQEDIIKIHRFTNNRGMVESCSVSLMMSEFGVSAWSWEVTNQEKFFFQYKT